MKRPVPKKGLPYAFGVLLLWASYLAAEPIPFNYGPGGNPLPPNRDIFWSEPPDLDGLVGSSEQILEFGLETELANDFFSDIDRTIILARWWGGYYNYTPGDPHLTSFNLLFYESTLDCVPGNLILEVVIPNNAHELLIYMQGDWPIYAYYHSVLFPVAAGHTYWFVAQAGDHPFPPQWGRLQSVESVGCDMLWRSEYFSYPNWENMCDLPPIYPCDVSQEFEDDSGPTPVLAVAWGEIKSLYR